jgi:predicted acetyltransferase
VEGLPLVKIAVVPATSADTPVLARLGQLSSYDFSEYAGTDVDANGRFGTADADNPFGLDPDEVDPVAFLVRVDGQIAGYAVVTRHDAYFDHGKPYLDQGKPYLLSQFFVMRKYRRRGVGEHVARTLFDRFPGGWEVATNPGREPAQTFWRRVIGRYAEGTYREAAEGCARWDGPIWTFESQAQET